MLLPDKVKIAVGKVVKTHGVNGELNVLLTEMAERDEDFDAGEPLIVEMEGLDVPYFVRSVRSRGGDSILLQLDELTTEAEARELVGHTLYIYASPDELDEEADGVTADRLTGYTITDRGCEVGRIESITELTPGCWYFELTDGRLIPVADELILSIDPEQRVVEMTLPEGLTEL